MSERCLYECPVIRALSAQCAATDAQSLGMLPSTNPASAIMSEGLVIACQNSALCFGPVETGKTEPRGVLWWKTEVPVYNCGLKPDKD